MIFDLCGLSKMTKCIVSNNCWGFCFYSSVWKIPYNTPFVGAYILPDEYITLLENITLLFENKATVCRITRLGEKVSFPIVSYPGVDVRFIHNEHTNDEEVLEKWNERLKRMPTDPSSWYFKFDDRDGCTEELMARFRDLPFPNKIAFVLAGKYNALVHSTNYILEVPCNYGDSVMSGDQLWNYTASNEKYMQKIAEWLG
jgi:uncharacterized protein (DUF1919 family)